MSVTYKDSGVDIEAGNKTVKLIKAHVKSTYNDSVESTIGSFAGIMNLEKLKQFKNPLLVASIDGVGTKVKVAAAMNKWDTVGQCLVNHSTNDILVIGATPFYFLDYVACEKLDPEKVEQILKGMSKACQELDLPLIKGETAEMPSVYAKGEYDIAGTITGIVDKDKIIDGKGITKDDVLIGLESNGLHTNGYSLARKVLFDVAGYNVGDYIEELKMTLGEELLKVHKCYSNAVLDLNNSYKIKGIAHITGGGLLENIPRIMPPGLGVIIEKSKIDIQPIFNLIQEKGNVPEKDMFRTFNMGVGLVLFVSAEDANGIIEKLKEKYNQRAVVIGKVVHREGVELI